MPNTFAYLMLMAWPLVCIFMFARMSPERAIVWSILGGYLLLPPRAAFDAPLIPSLDKASIPSLTALALCLFAVKGGVQVIPKSRAAKVLVALFVLGVIPTVLTNGDPILYRPPGTQGPASTGPTGLPGLSLHDTFSVVAAQIIVLIPFLLARQYLASGKGLREVLLALVIGALAYSIPSLIEVRLSPQINIWVYGFFQHNFIQMMREGGFRPIVFLPHALWLALFMVTAILAAAALGRAAPIRDRPRFIAAMLYLIVILVLCKSLASLVYGVVFTPVILFTSSRTQIRLAAILAAIAVTYPMLRNAGIIPVDSILNFATAYNPERAQSLAYRLGNEEQLLERAADKPWFGWGIWGRNLVHDAFTGEILTIPDGRWIIVFGMFGWIGYIAEMGLLALPLVLLAWRSRWLKSSEISPYATAVAMILGVTMIDMLLNATLIPYTWLCAGAVLGYAEGIVRTIPADSRRHPFGGGPVIGRNSLSKGGRPVL